MESHTPVPRLSGHGPFLDLNHAHCFKFTSQGDIISPILYGEHSHAWIASPKFLNCSCWCTHGNRHISLHILDLKVFLLYLPAFWGINHKSVQIKLFYLVRYRWHLEIVKIALLFPWKHKRVKMCNIFFFFCLSYSDVGVWASLLPQQIPNLNSYS